ncbi:Aste57867_33 [Aphanomyces stellatus]|uniref:Aste57867_33 protein n=1 Tax=Aphanomyces stellatus TaxID=120398 RepID=A0A485K1S0_9STRA|nr:hypothetical protein As57867_000033 [Aphanomyces stellatus]VFT77259.1 Aste57867_33 [Aphanomyces stellatus]
MATVMDVVLHSPALLRTVCSFQLGVHEAIQAVLEFPTVKGVHGRLVFRDRGPLPPSQPLGTMGRQVIIDMAELPAFMDQRRQAMAVVQGNSRASADLHALLTTHFRLRDIVAEYAAFYGDIELMQLICDHVKERLPWFQLDSRGIAHIFTTHVFHLAAFHGHASIMTLLGGSLQQVWRQGCLTRYSDLEVAAERGQLACLQNAVAFANSSDGSDTYWGLRNRLPFNHGGLAHYRGFTHLNLLDIVAGDGNIDVARVLFDHDAPYSDAAIDKAATNGHLAMVQYFHEKPNSKCTTDAMDGAATNGHLEVVQFLHEQRLEGCTTDAMDEAATYGHDAVVQFLLAKRKEGGSATAVNVYVTKGDLAMVQLLAAASKCAARSVTVAANHGHLEMVKYFVGEKEVPFAAPAIEAAVKHGHLDVIDYLRSRRPEMCVAKFMQMAHTANQAATVEYFDNYRCECCKGVGRDELLAAKPVKKRRRKN